MSPLVVIVLMITAVLLWTRLDPSARGRRGGGKRCNRCWKAVDQLQPVIDGRCEFWVCRLCAAEMEITNASTIDIPRG